MNDHESRSSRTRLSRLHELNRRRAREKARRIRADKLAGWIEHCIEWQTFVLWARAIVEAEGTIPPQVANTLQLRCPTFQPDAGVETEPEFWLRLRRWIDLNVFREPSQEGWLIAVEYYASRDLRWEQAWLCWEYCDEHWQRARPASYPSFDEWRHQVQAWRFPSREGKRVAVCDDADRVSPDRLRQAVSDYQDWEALAYWVRAVVAAYGMPPGVSELLRDKCPGFLEQLSAEGARLEDATTVWRRLIAWIDDHIFGFAKTEGWFEAITLFARTSLQGERTVSYWAACDLAWSRRRPADYPPFDEWRRAAEIFTER